MGVAKRAKKSRLKVPATSFLGRAGELSKLHAFFEAGARIVTLIGSGGTGKTRLALRYGELHEDDFASVCFCDLTEARDIGRVCEAVARAFDMPLRASKGAVEKQLGQAIAGRGRLLLILDNCEQCVADVARAVDAWRASAPSAIFLATSREVLNVDGEQVCDVPPLGVPSSDRDAASSEAVQLFVERARHVRSDWSLSDADTAHVIDIVKHLDGLPLAIELAAARMGMMSPQEIKKRLGARFELLASKARGVSERQRTLRGAIDWSWELSSAWEKSALMQCAVFRGGFPLEATEKIIDLSACAGAPSVIDAVQALKDKSYLRTYEPPDLPGELWFTMYESIREFAWEKLIASGDGAPLQRHAAFYVDAAEGHARAVWFHGGAVALRKLGAMRDNLNVAHERAMAKGDATLAARLAIALERVALDRGPHTTYAPMYDATIALVEKAEVDEHMLGRLLVARSFLRMLQVNRTGARADGERAAAIARRIKDRVLEVRAIQVIGQVAVPQGDVATVDASCARLEEVITETDDAHVEGLARMLLALILVVQGKRPEEARNHLERSLVRLREIGDAHRFATVLNVQGVLLAEVGELDAARDALEEAITVCAEMNDGFREASCRYYLACVCAEEGKLDDARELCERAVEMYGAIGETWQRALVQGSLGGVLAMQGDVEGATRAIERAESELAAFGDSIYVEAVRVHRGQIDLARARSCDSEGDGIGSTKWRAAAEARLLAANEAKADDVRFAVRMLRRSLGSAPSAVDAALPPDSLVVDADTTWFRPPNGKRVDLSGRKNLRLLLATLVEQRKAQPGTPVAVETLVARGWPGERILYEPGINRVRVAMTTLRQMGLRGILKGDSDGYLLDESIPLSG